MSNSSSLSGGENVFFLTDPPDPEVKLVLCPPRTKPNGVGVVVCPGGGYGVLCSSYEGYEIADWLGGFGITAAVLHYSIPGHHPEPLNQARKAIRILRSRAGEFGLRADRIGIMGFSAGGHVASSAATHVCPGDPAGKTREEQVSSRPDFQILIYPLITMGEFTHCGSLDKLLGPDPSAEMKDFLSNEKQVTDDTPPAFLCHSVTDQAVPVENSRMYVQALREHNVPVEYLELPEGSHGLGGSSSPLWTVWKNAAFEWLAGICPEIKPVRS